MMPAAEELAQAMESIVMHSPKIPVIHNVNVKTTKDPLEIKQWLVAQLYQPVRWVETIQALIAEGHTQFFECGPNRVLTGLCKRIDSGCQCISLCDSDSIDAVLTEQVGV
jgi:[acyl-carrier-protein] S-malonyltransferase